MVMTKEKLKTALKEKLFDLYGASVKNAEAWQLHNALAEVIMQFKARDMAKSSKNHLLHRRACYFSAEFLVGRAVYNNLLCLGLTQIADEALRECGTSLAALEEIEDAALGNGGLGRLAACYLDSAATHDIPLDGYGIRYRYGLFKQTIENGFQYEEPDDWARYGDGWARRRDSDAVTVTFGDGSVTAVPFDMPIFGYGTQNIGNLRLWQAEAQKPFDFDEFNNQNYDEAVREKNRAEDISRVLYPNDSTEEGRALRIKQQYFFASASVADILKKYLARNKGFGKLSEFITIQLNDTHPVVAVPELIRLLIQNRVSFERACQIAQKVFNYTNHTVMAEALEKWYQPHFKLVLPEIAAIIKRIDARLVREMKKRGLSADQIKPLRIIDNKMIHMARLACYMSGHINGVAQIHTEILKADTLQEWHGLFPERFVNVTNGITQRRWLALCNPELTSFIEKHIGNNDFVRNLDKIKELNSACSNDAAIQEFMQIKQAKKSELAEFLARDGIEINPDTIFDIQIKRLHEYKRQLLNAFSILHLYFEIKEGRIKNFEPTTFLFGAKSAPGYARAKGIIKYINEIAALVNSDKDVNRYIRVVFVPNYNVSAAEKLVAAADVSVQISTAGTEASGTGNMKLMLNGAVTLGTLDGANIEIVEQAGAENNYIFGATVAEIEKIMPDYNPKELYESNKPLKRVIDTLIDGTFSDGGTGYFKELYTSLLQGASWHKPDNYYLLGDFDSFINARLRLNFDAKNKALFAKKCLINTASAGKFSSDRSIKDYARDIWNLK